MPDNPAPAIRVLMVDDHPLLLEGIAAVLLRQPDIAVVGEAASGEAAVEAFKTLRPDVVLMDLVLPGIDGVEAIRQIRRLEPTACVLMLTTYRSDMQAWRALKEGAAGFLLKSSLRTDLVDAIRLVAAGGRWVPGDVAAEVSALAIGAALTERELRVLQYIAQGNSNREIGAMLALSEETIKSRLKLIMSKLKAKDRAHAVAIAMARGMLGPQH
jgi:two-component system NarL family response regulator